MLASRRTLDLFLRLFARRFARHFLFTAACECGRKRASERASRRLDLTALSSPFYPHPFPRTRRGMNVRILGPNEWRSDVCFECRFSPFVSTEAATQSFHDREPSFLLSLLFLPFNRSLSRADRETYGPAKPGSRANP